MLGAFRVPVFGLALFVLASCSLEGLDRFSFPECPNCEVLNRRDGIDSRDAQRCQVWQCDTARRECTYGDRDADGDRYVSALACRGTGDDCDDNDAATHPHAVERCDGRDNDCNGLIDDLGPSTPAQAQMPATVVRAGVSSPLFTTISDADDGFFAVWHVGTDPPDQFAAVTQIEMPTSSAPIAGLTNVDPLNNAATATTMGCPELLTLSLRPTSCDTVPCPGTAQCRLAMVDGHHYCEQGTIVSPTPPLTNQCTTNFDCQDGLYCNGTENCDPNASAALIDARGCRHPNLPPPQMPCATDPGSVCVESAAACVRPRPPTACRFARIDAARSGPHEWLLADIDACVSGIPGRVRVGFVDATATPPADVFWGDDHFSTIWRGIDPSARRGADAGCTGGHDAVAGASGVSIATLLRDTTVSRYLTQGLVAWRAEPAAMTGPWPVEILAVWREQSRVADQIRGYVNGSDDGVPVHLRDQTTSASIGVAAFAAGRNAVYVVAYARSGGGVAVSVVHAPPDAAALCSGSMPPCLFIDAGGVATTQLPASPSTRSTPRLAAAIPAVLDMASTIDGDVSIAAGVPAMATPTSIPIVLVWSTATDVVVARANVDAVSGVLTDGDRMHLPGPASAPPTVAHVDAGIALAGHFASDVITDAETGGFVVTWTRHDGATQTDTTLAARISDHTRMLVPPGAMVLGSALADHPRAFIDIGAPMEPGPVARVAAHQGDSLIAYRSVCGTPAR